LGQVRGAIVGLSLIPGLAFSAVLPPEHRHSADAHHPHATVHQHFAAHDDDDVDLSADGHGHVTWFDGVVAHPTSSPSFAPTLLAVAHLDDWCVPSRWVAVEAIETAPPHGPPRQSFSLRAPPALPSSTI
jgi:hypothetical protein